MSAFLSIIPTIFGLIGRAPQFMAVFEALGQLLSQINKLLPSSTQAAAKPLDVTWLQTTLKTLGFDPGAIDGRFGPATIIAVKAFQSANSLEVDGWPGVATTAALLSKTS